MGIVLSLYIILGMVIILSVLIIPLCKLGISFHLMSLSPLVTSCNFLVLRLVSLLVRPIDLHCGRFCPTLEGWKCLDTCLGLTIGTVEGSEGNAV